MEAMRDCLDPIASVRTNATPYHGDNVSAFEVFGYGENLQRISAGNQYEFSAPSQASGSSEDFTSSRKCSPGLSRRALMRTYAYMQQHIGDSFTLEDLARAACVSRFHFARAFRSSTGDSPMAYLLKLRIERAKRMLMRGNRAISETAAALGFFDQSHFARTFRRLTGFSPRQFARLYDDFDVHAPL